MDLKGKADATLGPININPTLTAFALSHLNNMNNGDDKFEIFCQKLIPLAIDKDFIPSSGLDAGGDGGLDGWSPLGDINKIKYGFSINKEHISKIKSEIKKIPSDEFRAVRLFTNQSVNESDKVQINKEAGEIIVTIYCLENLVEFVRQYPELGQFIDLPRIQTGIALDYARQHDPLIKRKSEIQNFLPRTYYSSDAGSSEYKEMSATELVQNDCSLIVVYSPAGCGKTCALEQLHQGILAGTVQYEIPPVFLRLADYVPGTLQQMINEALAASGDYQPTNFLLLLDGYDEVSGDDRRSLNKEISRILGNTPYFRKVIVTSRDYVPFGEFESIPQERDLAFLSPITRDNIDTLFKKMGITNQHEFWSNPFFHNFSNNVFYVVNFIAYYLDQNAVAQNVHELFSYLASKEIERIFRTTTPPVDLVESIALYMVLNQKQSIDRATIGDELPLPDNFPETLKFSHKNILEYLTARKIARQPLEQIKQIVAKGNLLLPHLTNTIGFVLNILVSDTDQGDYNKFDRLLQCIKGSGNAKRLLQIETDKVSTQVCQDVFTAVIDQEALTGNFFERPDSLIRFMLQRQESVESNVKALVDRILGNKNSDEYYFFILTLQNLCYTDINAISHVEQKRLVNFLFELLESEFIGRNHKFIERLLYIIPMLEAVSELEDPQLKLLVERVLSLPDESLFNNLCLLMNKARPVVDSVTYFKLYDFIVERHFHESGGVARIVPEQISDDDYQEFVRYTSWISFVPMSESFLEASNEHVWTFIRYTADNICGDDDEDSYSLRRDFEELYKVVFSQVQFQHSQTPLTNDQIDLLVTLLRKDSEQYHLGPLWPPMCDILDSALLHKLVYRFLACEEAPYIKRQEIVSFHCERIQTVEDFDSFMEAYEVNGSDEHKKYFRSFCYYLPEDGPLAEHMLSFVSEELRDRILIKNENAVKHKEYDWENEARLAYAVFYNSEELIKQSEAVFDAFDTDTLSKKELYRNEQAEIMDKKFPGALFFLRAFLTDSESTVKQDKIGDVILSPNWYLNFMFPLIDYCNHNNIGFDKFKTEELERTKAWVSNLLEKHPVGSADAVFNNYHITLTYVLRQLPIDTNEDEVFLSANRNRVVGLAFSGFPAVHRGSYSVGYESFSLDYLEAYIQKKTLIEFIVNNFDKAFESRDKMIAVCGYLESRRNELKPHQKHTIRKYLTTYLNDNLCSQRYSEVSNLSNEVGVKITDSDSVKFADALVTNDRNSGLEYNYAAGYLHHTNKELSSEDRGALQSIVLSAFGKRDDTFLKKTLAEYYLQMNKRAGNVFVYYADYLMSGDNPIMNRTFGQWGGAAKQLATSELAHLSKVQELFLYSTKKKKSERRDAIRDMAIESFRLIAAEIDNEDDFAQVVQSMKTIAEDGNRWVYRHIQELRDSFAERTYLPLTIKEIANMAS